MKASEFLDAEASPRRKASAFLDAPHAGTMLEAINAGPGYSNEPTAEELAPASRPARMTLTRAGQPVLQPNAPEPTARPAEPEGPTSIERAAVAAEPYVTPALKTVKAIASGYPVAETAANLA